VCDVTTLSFYCFIHILEATLIDARMPELALRLRRHEGSAVRIIGNDAVDMHKKAPFIDMLEARLKLEPAIGSGFVLPYDALDDGATADVAYDIVCGLAGLDRDHAPPLAA
jgi:hypothetical protein